MRPQILFITSNRLGDAILSTGILEALYRQHPQAQFTVACGPIAAPLFEDHPAVQNMIPLIRQGTLGHWADLWRRTVLTPWQCVVDIRGSAFAYCVVARRRYVWRSKRMSPKHRAQQLADLLQLSQVPDLKIYLSQHRLDTARALLDLKPSENVIAIAPVANWAGKQWSMERYIQLIQALSVTKINGHSPHKFLILAAPDEYPQLTQLFQSCTAQHLIVLQQNTHILQCAAALSQCRLFVGNDSGLMHMAAALGVPTVGLFGPSPDQLYAPWGPCTAVVRTRESYNELWARHLSDPQAKLMESISVNQVMAAVQKLLEISHDI